MFNNLITKNNDDQRLSAINSNKTHRISSINVMHKKNSDNVVNSKFVPKDIEENKFDYTKNLDEIKTAIKNKDGEKLMKIFSSTKKVRKEIIKAGQDTDKPGFGRK
jgi:predicted YcjX-like family ATPase